MFQGVQNKAFVKSTLLKNKEEISKFGVDKIAFFGSFVREEEKKNSDIDILVEFLPGKKTYDNFINLAYFLEDLFGRKVDLLTKEGLSSYIKPHILKELEYAI